MERSVTLNQQPLAFNRLAKVFRKLSMYTGRDTHGYRKCVFWVVEFLLRCACVDSGSAILFGGGWDRAGGLLVPFRWLSTLLAVVP